MLLSDIDDLRTYPSDKFTLMSFKKFIDQEEIEKHTSSYTYKIWIVNTLANQAFCSYINLNIIFSLIAPLCKDDFSYWQPI